MHRRLLQAWWSLVRFGFRLLYNEFAWTYDLISICVSLGQWRAWQNTCIPHLKTGLPVLELAFGTGNLQIDLQKRGFEIYGLDLSPYMGRIASRKLAKMGLARRLTRGNAQQLPYRDATFGSVVSTFPTEFIVNIQTINEIHRVLMPCGRFVVIVNGQLTSMNILARFLEWLYRITGQRAPLPGRPIQLLTDSGFSAREVKTPVNRSQTLLIVAEKRHDVSMRTAVF
nr:class I SAM-dependent methyltransferase [Anaerolineae bacterium]